MVNECHWYKSDGLNNKFTNKISKKQDEDEEREWLSKERKTTRLWGAKQNALHQTSLIDIHIMIFILNPTKKGSWVFIFYATYKDVYFSGKAR